MSVTPHTPNLAFQHERPPNSTLTSDHASALQGVCSIARKTRLMRSRGQSRMFFLLLGNTCALCYTCDLTAIDREGLGKCTVANLVKFAALEQSVCQILSLFLIAIATDLQSRRVGPTLVVENSPHNPEVPLGDVESDDHAPNPVMAESTLLLSAPRILTLASQTRDLAAVQVTRVTVLRL
jgi:hypothetical protein